MDVAMDLQTPRQSWRRCDESIDPATKLETLRRI